MGLVKGNKVILMSTMILGVGCHPSIFIYNFQLMETLPIDALTAGPGTAEAAAGLQTDYELTFTGNEGGQNKLIHCFGDEGFDPKDITSVTPMAWVIAGPYYDGNTAYSENLAGTSLARDWPMQIEVGGGSACGRGEVIGELTVPEGTLNLPRPSDYLQAGYYPDEADLIGGWSPFQGQEAFEEEVINGMETSNPTGVGVGFQTRVCVDPLRISGDSDSIMSTNLHFLHLVQFEIEGTGNPCVEIETTE